MPLELVDLLSPHVSGPFFQFLGRVDPYDDVLVPPEAVASALKELAAAMLVLKRMPESSVPHRVDLYSEYGKARAIQSLREIEQLIERALEHGCKLVSIGD